MNLPNLITLARIVLAMIIVPLLFMEQFGPRMVAFVIFLIAAFSDLWDGHLARSRGLVTDLGKLLDPIADKLLLAATLIPFYILSHRPGPGAEFPWFGGTLPLWVVVVIFGRELFITLFRSYAARRGVIIPAGVAGKYKAVFQSFFVGSSILWYALLAEANLRGWDGPLWAAWTRFHFWFSVVVLCIALFLTIYSMAVYLWNYRAVVSAHEHSRG